MKRRDFFKNTLLGTGFTLFALTTNMGCTTSGTKDDTNRNPATDAEKRTKLRVRYEATSPEALVHLQAYEKAISVMQKKPQFINNNRRLGNGMNWMRQAQIHMDHCPHGSWAFFPWHREYLYRFEEIIREASGFEDFALPYWDWTKNNSLPEFCRDVKKPFFMNEPSRKQDISNLVVAQTHSRIINHSLAVKDFISFMGSKDGSGEIEYGPHNGVHVAMGGTMGTFKSPMDPIFWMHHCNVDRLWAVWQEANPHWIKAEEIQDKYPAWLNIRLEGFYDRQGLGLKVPRYAKDVLDTFAEPLKYCYPETLPGDNGLRKKPRLPSSVGRTKVKVRANNRDAIKFALAKLPEPNSYKFTLPNFKGNVGRYIDDYLRRPEDFKNFYFRLKTEGFPKLPAGTSLKISLLHSNQEIFITNYNFFSSTKEQSIIKGLIPIQQSHHDHDEHAEHRDHLASDVMPKFYFDYEKILLELKNKAVVDYPELTEFKVEFVTTAFFTRKVLDPKLFDEIKFKLVILERVDIDGINEPVDEDND